MKSEMKLKIDDDKTLKFEVTTLMDNEMIDGMLSLKDMDLTGDTTADPNAETKEYTDEERWNFLESGDSSLTKTEGYKLEKYDKDGFLKNPGKTKEKPKEKTRSGSGRKITQKDAGWCSTIPACR